MIMQEEVKMSIFYLKTPNVHSTICVLGLLFIGANVGTRSIRTYEQKCWTRHRNIFYISTPAIFTYVLRYVVVKITRPNIFPNKFAQRISLKSQIRYLQHYIRCLGGQFTCMSERPKKPQFIEYKYIICQLKKCLEDSRLR